MVIFLELDKLEELLEIIKRRPDSQQLPTSVRDEIDLIECWVVENPNQLANLKEHSKEDKQLKELYEIGVQVAELVKFAKAVRRRWWESHKSPEFEVEGLGRVFVFWEVDPKECYEYNLYAVNKDKGYCTNLSAINKSDILETDLEDMILEVISDYIMNWRFY